MGQLISIDRRDVPDHMTSCSVINAEEKREKRWEGNNTIQQNTMQYNNMTWQHDMALRDMT